MNYLIYCPRIAGHRLEYIHHLYLGAIKRKNKNYVIVVPREFDLIKNKFKWPLANNITFCYIEKEIIQSFKCNFILSELRKCKHLQNVIKVYKPEEVIVLDMIEYVPFLPLFVSSKVKVSGIIYRIFLYEYKEEGIIKRFLDVFKYKWMSAFPVYDRIFILNDIKSAAEINTRFSSSKYLYLPDPVVPIEKIDEFDFRDEYKIPKDNVILLHPGGMLPYKGTIEILKALNLLDGKSLNNITIIFAGRVTESIKEEFDALCNCIKTKVQLIVEEGFLPYERLGALIKQCDWLLIPYKTKSQSSGIVGHAAYFEKPVIAVKGGVIGNIVSTHKLGVLIDSPTPECIKDAILSIPDKITCKNNYCKVNTIENFNNIILK